MKDKRGFLLGEETVKLVVAVIGILFLVGLLLALYFSYRTSQELEQAKSSLNFLMSEINSGKDRVEIYNPKTWWISAWDELGVPYPSSCSNLGWDSCICICEKESADSCANNGICLENTKNFKVMGESGIEGRGLQITSPPITLDIDQTNKKISLITQEAGGGFGGGGGGGF